MIIGIILRNLLRFYWTHNDYNGIMRPVTCIFWGLDISSFYRWGFPKTLFP